MALVSPRSLMRRFLVYVVLHLCLQAHQVRAAVTIYSSTSGATPAATPTSNSPNLVPPTPPGEQLLPRQIPVQLLGTTPANAGGAVGGNFMGWSVELSVADQIFGKSPGTLQVPFLNYMANIRNRAKSGAIIRVGGNSQDSSTFSASLPTSINKTSSTSNNPSDTTPEVTFGPSLLYTLSNISSLVDVNWIYGVSMASTVEDSNAIQAASSVNSILGSNLYSIQIGNEPDLYASHGQRPSTYGIPDYVNEFGKEVGDIQGGAGLPRKDLFVGPSVCCNWNASQVIAAGYLDRYADSLTAFAVQRYPDNNCAAIGKTNGRVVDPQSVFSNYLNHTGATFTLAEAGYVQAAPQVVAKGKRLVMLETNSASCGGFPGVSDSFGAAIWAVDYVLQLAYINFSAVLFHQSGRGAFYNSFTPPQTNQSSYRGWTTGPIYYSSLFVAEALGSSNQSRVVDLNTPSIYAPAYAIYENNVPTRVVLVNYVTDASGNSDYQAVVSVPAGPDHVNVKYLRAPSVSEKFNITFAGQTWAGDSDGRPQGAVTTLRVPCDTNSKSCTITVPAPSVALVFLTDDALAQSSVPQGAVSTFATTAYTNGYGTATIVDPSVLATSNGRSSSSAGRTAEVYTTYFTALVFTFMISVSALGSLAVLGAA